MATLLYRLGKASFQNARRVLLAWLVGLMAIAGLGLTIGGQTNEDFNIPGSESQVAFERLEAVFPSFAGASVQAVIVAPEGERLDSDENRVVLEQLTQALRASPGVETATGPFDEFAGRAISDDARYAFIQVQFDRIDVEVSDEMLASLVATKELVATTDLVMEFGGNVFQDQEVGFHITEVLGVLFAALVLMITFRSFRPSWIPLASALVGVGISLGVIYFLAVGVTVSSSAPFLAVMLGLAVGIDYSLFILSRHRTQLAQGQDPVESAATAVGTAGNAVVFAGLTVIIALLGLFVVGLPFLSVMGSAAAIAVAIAILAAITLLPALMGLAGDKMRPQPGSGAARLAMAGTTTPSFGRRWVRFVMRHPLAVSTVSVVGLGVLALPALSLDLNLPGGGQEPVDSTQRKAYDYISEGFGPGFNGPLLISADITGSDDIMGDLESLREDLSAVSGVEYVGEGYPSPGLDTGIFQVVPQYAPDSAQTKDLLRDIREEIPAWEETYGGDIAVTGFTAIGVDLSQRIQNALIPFGLVVVGLSILLLLAVFRSMVVPIKAALGFVLSVTAAFGVVVAVFQWGWFGNLVGVDTPGPILSFMPILLMAVLFGLAMDYEVFLVSGMRERFAHSKDWRSSLEEGYASGARVVTAAALIMFFVFFAFVPQGSTTIKPIALGLAVGIALDAFVVRMTLVPALMALFKDRAWWLPKALERRVPHADVEGEKLRDHLLDTQWSSATSEFSVYAEDLVWESSSAPVHLQWRPGERVDILGDVPSARMICATLAGALAPTSGSVHLAGHPLPSESAFAREHVAVWNTTEDDLMLSLTESLRQRLSWSRSVARTSAAERSRRITSIVARLNDLSRTLTMAETPVVITGETRPALLPRAQQILVLSAMAVLEGARVCLVNPLEPLRDAQDRAVWWLGLDAFATEDQTVGLFSDLVLIDSPQSSPATAQFDMPPSRMLVSA